MVLLALILGLTLFVGQVGCCCFQIPHVRIVYGFFVSGGPGSWWRLGSVLAAGRRSTDKKQVPVWVQAGQHDWIRYHAWWLGGRFGPFFGPRNCHLEPQFGTCTICHSPVPMVYCVLGVEHTCKYRTTSLFITLRLPEVVHSRRSSQRHSTLEKLVLLGGDFWVILGPPTHGHLRW